MWLLYTFLWVVPKLTLPEVNGGRWWIQVRDNNRKVGSQSRRTGLLRPAMPRVWANPDQKTEFREQLIELVGRITSPNCCFRESQSVSFSKSLPLVSSLFLISQEEGAPHLKRSTVFGLFGYYWI